MRYGGAIYALPSHFYAGCTLQQLDFKVVPLRIMSSSRHDWKMRVWAKSW